VNQKLASALLAREGHRAVVAESGRRALELLDAQGKFDLILMDVQMPDMDGYEATAEIRQRERGSGRHIPIVAMTAHAMVGDKERCLLAGMDQYVTKPVRKKDLFEAMEQALATSVEAVTPVEAAIC
jgi:CheY-like chemotaxis protein